VFGGWNAAPMCVVTGRFSGGCVPRMCATNRPWHTTDAKLVSEGHDAGVASYSLATGPPDDCLVAGAISISGRGRPDESRVLAAVAGVRIATASGWGVAGSVFGGSSSYFGMQARSNDSTRSVPDASWTTRRCARIFWPTTMFESTSRIWKIRSWSMLTSIPAPANPELVVIV
jgi:hypothetical protein